MFGLGKPKQEALVGAKRKLEHAKQFKAGFQVKSKREGKEPNPSMAILIVWTLGVALAALLTQAVDKKTLVYSTGNAGFDKLMFGSPGPAFFGSPDIDYVVLLLVRGTILFIAAGIVPGCTLLWQRVFDKPHMNVYIGFWGVTLGLALLYAMSLGFFGELFKELSLIFS